MTIVLKKTIFLIHMCLMTSILTQAMEDKPDRQDRFVVSRQTLQNIQQDCKVQDRKLRAQMLFQTYIQSAYILGPSLIASPAPQFPKMHAFVPCFLMYLALDVLINTEEYFYFNDKVKVLDELQNQVTPGSVVPFWKHKTAILSEQKEWIFMKTIGAVSFGIVAFPYLSKNSHLQRGKLILGMPAVALTLVSNSYILDWNHRLHQRTIDVEKLYLENSRLNE